MDGPNGGTNDEFGAVGRPPVYDPDEGERGLDPQNLMSSDSYSFASDVMPIKTSTVGKFLPRRPGKPMMFNKRGSAP